MIKCLQFLNSLDPNPISATPFIFRRILSSTEKELLSLVLNAAVLGRGPVTPFTNLRSRSLNLSCCGMQNETMYQRKMMNDSLTCDLLRERDDSGRVCHKDSKSLRNERSDCLSWDVGQCYESEWRLPSEVWISRIVSCTRILT